MKSKFLVFITFQRRSTAVTPYVHGKEASFSAVMKERLFLPRSHADAYGLIQYGFRRLPQHQPVISSHTALQKLYHKHFCKCKFRLPGKDHITFLKFIFYLQSDSLFNADFGKVQVGYKIQVGGVVP